MKRQEEEQERRREIEESRLSPSISRRTFFTKSMIAGLGVMGLGLLDNKLAAAAVFGAERPLATTTMLQLCTIPFDGPVHWNILHTARFADGSWSPAFGNVNAQESNGNLQFLTVDCAGLNGDLHVVANAENMLWHTIRYGANGGSWEPQFGNINAQESNGNKLSFSGVSCAVTPKNKLHICALDGTGKIWHTIRYPDGHWSASFDSVNKRESNGSLRFSAVDCATVGEDLHVCAIDKNGILWHTIRSANGSWVPQFGNVNDQESNGGSLRFVDVGCVVIGSDLHVCAVDNTFTGGMIWHTIRFAAGSGSWEPQFGNVNDQSNGGNLRFLGVDCANVANTLYVVGIEKHQTSFHLWYTIRYGDGSWEPQFVDINALESNGNIAAPANAVGISGA